MEPCVTKAEVLLTRRCNIQCGTCRVIDPARDETGQPRIADGEMSVAEWKRAFDVVYGKLGASFVALYGGEPLVYGDDKLIPIIRHLASHRSEVNDFTIISNGIGLTQARAEAFVAAGLDSWTSSVDAVGLREVGDKYMNAKTPAGLRALARMAQLGVRDTMAIITVTRKNLDHVHDAARQLTALGHWIGIDLLHYQRGDGEFTFSTSRDEMESIGLTLTLEDMPRLRALSAVLIHDYDNLRLFPSKEVIAGWADPRLSIELGWKCVPGHSITIDFDGSIGLCDDRMPTGYGDSRMALAESHNPARRPWHIHDFDLGDPLLTLRWEDFMRWYAEDLDMCSGCYWSTHCMAVDAMRSTSLRKRYAHK